MKNINWKEICEEDWYNKRRKCREDKKEFCNLIYSDKYGNKYYYIPIGE